MVTKKVAAILPVYSFPQEVVITPDGNRAYVINADSNVVLVIDTYTFKIIATVVVGTGPAGAAVTPDGSHVYVANFDSNTVSMIRTLDNVVVCTIHVGTNPGGIARHGGKLTWISEARRREEPNIGIEASTTKPYFRWSNKRNGTDPYTGTAPGSEPDPGKVEQKLLDEFE
jgi:YVTN family beta-propeller protein